MKIKAIIPLLLLVALSACETPWYRLQKENDALKAENQRLLDDRTGYDDQLYKSQAQLTAAQNRIKQLQTQNKGVVSKLKTDLVNTGLDVKMIDGRPAIVLPNSILFSSGKHSISSSGKTALKKVASLLNAKYGKYKVIVQGHTDSDPIRRSKYADNYQLSAERARAVLTYLSKTAGVKSKRLQGAFFGPNSPVSSSKSKNRRVELVLIN